jgi:hypothetical protein
VASIHFAFVLFAVLGGLLALRWLRHRAGSSGYSGGFIEHYLMPMLYPVGLTRSTQWVLGIAVITINVAIYGWILARAKTSRRRDL